MHQHDPNLIMALAEGTIPDGEASAARHEISGCATCSADLDAQLTALEALRAAPAAMLTDSERSELRAALRTELRLETPAGATAPPARKRRRWAPAWALGGAAAVLIAVLAVGPALQRFSGGDDDAAAGDEVALASTTSAPTAPAPLPDFIAPPLSAGSEQRESDAADGFTDDTETSAQVTTAAPTTTTAASLPQVALTDIADLRLGAYFDFVVRTQGNLALATQLYASSVTSTGPAPGILCEPPPELEISPNAEVAAVALARIESGELAPVFAYRNPNADTPILVVYDPAGCVAVETVTPQP